ncbi:MAG: hypothetical protein GY726_12850 [Proteobacteria bacterium]|nr:hypothetical protein [Pseudomonadota bacterium]
MANPLDVVRISVLSHTPYYSIFELKYSLFKLKNGANAVHPLDNDPKSDEVWIERESVGLVKSMGYCW